MAKVLGRTIRLTNGRLIFLGTSDETPDVFYFGFRSSEGEDTKFTFSREARDALEALLTDPMAGMPLADFPHQRVWELVKGDAP